MTTETERFVAAAEALDAGDFQRWSELTREDVPVHDLMGLDLVQLNDPTLLAMPLTNKVRGAGPGTVHGGLLATLADVASAVSLQGAYAVGTEVPVTTDMHVRYYRQPQTGPVTAEAKVVHRGRRLLGTECSITDGDGRVLTRSTATYMVVPIRL